MGGQVKHVTKSNKSHYTNNNNNNVYEFKMYVERKLM